ncbi:MAG: hypothetical protein LBU69_06770 [Deltaproteobacteria bacterium]|nr:hypothetical protein [Deltaproteobacteria bacterium]
MALPDPAPGLPSDPKGNLAPFTNGLFGAMALGLWLPRQLKPWVAGNEWLRLR